MADVTISNLNTDSSPAAGDFVPVSKADGSSTSKVTLQKIADLAVTSGKAVSSDATWISGADTITNIVSLTQLEYDSLATYDAQTLYIIVG